MLSLDAVRELLDVVSRFLAWPVLVSLSVSRRVGLPLSAENLLDRQYYLFSRNPGRAVFGGLYLRY